MDGEEGPLDTDESVWNSPAAVGSPLLFLLPTSTSVPYPPACSSGLRGLWATGCGLHPGCRLWLQAAGCRL